MEERDILIFLHSLFLNENYFESILELDDLESMLTKTEHELKQIENSTKRSVEKIIESRSKEYIKRLVDNINKNCTQVLTIFDEDYPMELKLIENPPKVLYIKGLPLNLEGVKIGVVGARKCTAYGKYVVEKFVSELSNMNATIISGMADGIDAHAHKTALENGAYTIGVLGTGVDIKFPKSNHKLYDKMYELGTIISEYPLGTEALPFYFPARNRIISGLSDGVIVAEAKEKSGSLITARLAAEQGKEVFSIPGNINSIYSVGTNKLIRDGAIPLLEIEDIVSIVPGLRDNIEKMEQLTFDGLSEIEELVLNLIGEGKSTEDEIVEHTDLEVNKISSTITLLEMKGLIKRFQGMGFQKI